MIYLFEDISQYTDELFQKSLDLLSEQRKVVVEKYKNKKSKKNSAMAYLLLCYGLKKEYNIAEELTWDFDFLGKPYLREYPDIHFNISHCQSSIVCAISKWEVGVDVENIRTVSTGIMRKSCSEEEFALMAQLPEKERNIEFIKLWTQKESITKFTGEGIQRDFKKLTAREYSTIFWKEEGKDYCFSVYGPEYRDLDDLKNNKIFRVNMKEIEAIII